MLLSMVAIPALDLVVSIVWVGALAVVLLAQAVYAWLGHRQWARYARHAARLAEATRFEPRVIPGGLSTPAIDEPRDGDTDVPAEA
jgi:hypothetical protein